MMKKDVPQEGFDIPKIEYDIYCKLNGSNSVKLDKSHCKNVKAELSVHAVLKDDIEKLNTSSDFYNDDCYVLENGTYITREDRKKEYIKGKKAVCQDGCVFADYDYENLKAKCSCEIKESSSSFALMKIDKDKLFGNFVNVKNIANFNILKCYKQLFSIKGIKNNIGTLIIIPIIIFHIICTVLFYKKNLSVILDKIKDIVFGITNWKLVRKDEREKRLKIKMEKERLRKEMEKERLKKEKEEERLKKEMEDERLKKEMEEERLKKEMEEERLKKEMEEKLKKNQNDKEIKPKK
jgi:hypothetical protein